MLFPAYVTYGEDRGSEVEEFTPDGTETSKPGELVFYDTGAGTMKRCGADPALIAGIAEVDSEEAKKLTSDGKCPFRLLFPGAVVVFSSATTPVEATHRGNEYGITRDATTGFWQLDIAKTGASARFVVRRVEIAGVDGASQDRFYCQLLGQYAQFDGVDS